MNALIIIPSTLNTHLIHTNFGMASDGQYDFIHSNHSIHT